MSDSPENDAQDPGDGGPKIAASPEMEEALREAEQAYEERSSGDSAGAEGDDSASSPDKMTIELLSKELQELKALHEEKLAELDEQQDQYVRLQAEFENFRRRGLKEKQESLKFGHQNLVKDLLSTVDNLERAIEHGAQAAGSDAGEPSGEVKGILDGVALVYREILGALAKHGVQEIEAEGRVFDPAFHEAMGQIPNGSVPPNTILEVLQKGYVIHERMLRPTRVIVSREPSAEEATTGSGDSD